MSADLAAARQFIESNARVLERHQLAVLFDGGPAEPVLTALKAYHNADGGFGHALEPDVRCPGSQPSAALSALDVLAGLDAAHDPMVTEVADWIAAIAHQDGGVPTVLPSAEGHPRAPWMTPNPEAGFLTYALAAALWRLGVRHPWLDKATEWCWNHIDAIDAPSGYTVLFALQFLDAVPDPARAAAAVDRFRPAIRDDVRSPSTVASRTNTSSRSTCHHVPERRAGRCSATRRSLPMRTGSRLNSSTTAAGTSTSCTSRPARPWNGAVWSPLVPSAPCANTAGRDARMTAA
jgi:hypothetical protein